MVTFREKVDLAIHFDNLKLIASKKSALQKIEVYQHPLLGKMLVINGELQHVEEWAPLYHELVVHLPTSFIPKLKKVLILGGGSLFAAAEVLKYKSVQSVTLVDHDKKVVDIIGDNYAHAKKVLSDKRFKLENHDAFKWLKSTDGGYDLILNDSVDLIKHGRQGNSDLLKLLCSKLSQHGVCSDLVYRHIFERKTSQMTLQRLRKDFHCRFSLIAVPEYPGILHILCLWSKTNTSILRGRVINEIQKEWADKISSPCIYFNPKYIQYYLYFPKYLTNVLKG